MRRRRLLALLALAPLALGCPETASPPRELADDLGRWMKAVREWEPTERKIFAAIGKLNQQQFVDDEEVAATLKETLPLVRDHNRKAAAFEAKTEELAGVVRHFRKGWEDLELAFHAVISAAEAKDYQRLGKARDRLQYARGEILGSFASLDELLQQTDLRVRMLERKEQLDREAAEQEAAAEPPS